MIDVANIGLCKKLFNLTGWYASFVYQNTRTEEKPFIELKPFGYHSFVGKDGVEAVAYDLGFLITKMPRKLPQISSKERDGLLNIHATRGKQSGWIASYADSDSMIISRKKIDAESNNKRNFWYVHAQGETPEDAVARLCIELLKQELIK